MPGPISDNALGFQRHYQTRGPDFELICLTPRYDLVNSSSSGSL